jgi:hypothetical protein
MIAHHVITSKDSDDIFYVKHVIEGPLRQMDCGHERIFYREVGETFRCSMCGHINGSKKNE